MPSTFSAFATETLSTTSASIVFSSIPQNYTDIYVYGQVWTTESDANGGRNLLIAFNNSTTGYSTNSVHSTGTGVSGNATTSTTSRMVAKIGGSAEIGMGGIYLWIPSYSKNNNYKVCTGYSGYTGSVSAGTLTAGAAHCYTEWQNTSAVSSIKFEPGAGFFKSGTKITLFGVYNG